MTTLDFIDQFDIFYNNITSNQAPGLDEYEKSVLLTAGQDDIVKAYFNPKGNKYVEGFGDNPKRDIDFSKLLKVVKYIPTDGIRQNTDDYLPIREAKFDTRSNSASIDFPSDVLFVVNELAIVSREGNNTILQVIPINYLEYTRLMAKPYKRPLRNQAWRIGNTDKLRADLVVGVNDIINEYIVRYIRRPSPIKLSLDSLDSIPCELDEELHLEVLKRAVELAKSAFIGDLLSTISLGQVSSTNMGIVSQQGSDKS